MKIHQLPVMEDNFIYVLENDGKAAVIDPGVSEPVLDFLNEKNLSLDTILITHHHPDHIRGVPALLGRYPGLVIHGSKRDVRIHFAQKKWGEGDEFTLFGQPVQVWEVDGHTVGHIAYYFPKHEAGSLFSGDVLFSLGCGKLFEGTAEQMWKALSRIRSLPESVKVYGSHEYTVENSKFALHIDADNQDLLNMVQRAKTLRANNQATVPTSVAEEKRANPFLRPENFQHKLALDHEPLWKVFAALRGLKDQMDRGETIRRLP